MAAKPTPYTIGQCQQIWSQAEDCCGRVEETTQYITVSSEPEGYLTIKTERWALDYDDIDRFCRLLKEFARRYCQDQFSPSNATASQPEPARDRESVGPVLRSPHDGVDRAP